MFLQIDHPFVVNLRYAFQDDENCFFVLDLMLGGDLRCRFILSKCYAAFDAQTPQFTYKGYAPWMRPQFAFMLLSWHPLWHIYTIGEYSIGNHSGRFQCSLLDVCLPSDIKPDNILLDAAGHAHLTDFNVASHYSFSKPLTSVAGSMAYIAPEVTARKGYTYTPDWWSLGVTAYELLFGTRPYTGRNGEELISNIKRGVIPKYFADPDGKCSPDAIQVLQGVRLYPLQIRVMSEHAFLPDVGERSGQTVGV